MTPRLSWAPAPRWEIRLLRVLTGVLVALAAGGALLGRGGVVVNALLLSLPTGLAAAGLMPKVTLR